MSFSNMIKGFVNGEEIAYVKNGLVLKGVTMQVMVGSEDDLVNLPEDIMPGSVAFTAGYGSMWQKAADGSWEEISQEGGGGGGLVVGITHTMDVETDIYTLDKTWKEIKDAITAGSAVWLVSIELDITDNAEYVAIPPAMCYADSYGYSISAIYGDTTFVFNAQTENDYPFMAS